MNTLIEYQSPTYRKRTYYLINTSISNITQIVNLYLVNASTSSLVYIYVDDESGYDLTGAYVKLLRYYTDTNTYRTVEISKTDYQGLASLWTILDEVFYKFIVEKKQKVLPPTPTDKDKIHLTTLYLTVQIKEPFLEEFDQIENVAYSLFYNNETRVFSFTFNDASGVAQQGCLKVKHSDILREKIVYDGCTTGTAATLTYTLDSGNLTGYYTGYGYIKVEGSGLINVLKEGVTATFGSFQKGYTKFGATGIFMTIILVASLATIGILSESIVIPVALGVLGLVGAFAMGLIFISYTIIASIVLLALLVILKLRR